MLVWVGQGVWFSASSLEVQSHFHSRPKGKNDSVKVVEFLFARMILQNTPGTKHFSSRGGKKCTSKKKRVYNRRLHYAPVLQPFTGVVTLELCRKIFQAIIFLYIIVRIIT